VRALVETGVLAGGPGERRLAKPLDTIAVPPTVQAILAARIDRLAPEDKRLLQAAAVVGKDVPFRLVSAVGDLDDDGLRRGLERLQAAEFLYEVSLFPDLEYTFKHALTHEVAYGSVLGDRRRALHAALVGAIERLHADRLDEHVERLAHHALRGELREQAARYLQQAGDRAAARSANREAVTLFEQAIPVLDALPETPELLARTVDVHLALATTLVGIKGAGASETEVSYHRARERAERLGDSIRLYQSLWGLWYVNFGRGHYGAARELGERLLALAQKDDDTGRRLEAHHALWPTLTAMGEPRAALPHFEHGLALYDPERHASQAFVYGGHDAGVCCRSFLARAQWFLGYPQRAAAATRDAISLAERLGHPLTTVHALASTALVMYQLGEWRAAREHARWMQEVTDAHGFAAWADDAAILLGAAGLREGVAGSLDALYARIQATPLTSTSNANRWVVSRVVVADAAAATGELTRALGVLDTIPPEHQAVAFASEILRIRGEVFLDRGQPDDAERCYLEAITIARRRAQRSCELRAAMGLARLLARRGRSDEARSDLAQSYSWFTEGFETADLRAARTLLDELEGPTS
jgi:tetratricopeptide (TPR) repeat protein